MTDKFPRGEAAIVGAATYGMGECPGHTDMEMAAKAALKALAQANLKPADVDGLFICQPQDHFSTLSFPEYMGMNPRFTDNNRTGGSGFLIHAHMAAMALATGACDVALIVYGSTQRSNAGKLVALLKPSIYQQPYKPLLPISGYALAAARHMHEFGTTRRHLAEVAVAARKWAQLNPDAYMRDELSIDQVLEARLISDPLSVRDCCLVTDGAAAIVMTRADRAKDHSKKPVYVLGGAHATTHLEVQCMADLTTTGAAQSGKQAFAQAGVRPADIDLAMVYDAFTINTILFLEDLGFCPKGEGGRFVENGGIAPGGHLAVNTNGGGLSCVHPGMYGMFLMVEAFEQLTGIAGARQVKDAKLAVAHGNGGILSSQATLVLGDETTL